MNPWPVIGLTGRGGWQHIRPVRIYLETDRLLLREFTADDVDNLYALDSDPEVMRFIDDGKPTPREVIERERLPALLDEYHRHPGLGGWPAVAKATGAFIGWFGLRPTDAGSPVLEPGPGNVELGYRLRRSAWGKGYATEGSRALIRMAFTELGAHRVCAGTMAVNTRSRRVMERSGLHYVRTYHLTWEDPLPGTEHGEVEYAVTREQWERAAAGEPAR